MSDDDLITPPPPEVHDEPLARHIGFVPYVPKMIVVESKKIRPMWLRIDGRAPWEKK